MSKNIDPLFQALEKYSKGVLGISAEHIESGQSIEFHAEQRFLMCSTYKVAIATYLLSLVETQGLNFNELNDVRKEDFLPGMYSSLNQLNYDVPQKISLHSLMLLMLQESCNTATRIILNRIGDTEAVDAFLKSKGINDIGKDYYTMASFAEFEGITALPKNCGVEEFNRLAAQVPFEEQKRAREKIKTEISHSEISTATPRAMTMLLTYLFKGKLISNESAKRIFTAMRRCRTGPQRIMGLLPPQTPVAHKTGSLTGYTCDIGLITLPHNAGHIALSVYIKDWTSNLVIAERTIAEATRSIYDAFLLNWMT